MCWGREREVQKGTHSMGEDRWRDRLWTDGERQEAGSKDGREADHRTSMLK